VAAQLPSPAWPSAARRSRPASGFGTIFLILLVSGTGIEPVTPTV
jgi:hypothetical protein